MYISHFHGAGRLEVHERHESVYLPKREEEWGGGSIPREAIRTRAQSDSSPAIRLKRGTFSRIFGPLFVCVSVFLILGPEKGMSRSRCAEGPLCPICMPVAGGKKGT